MVSRPAAPGAVKLIVVCSIFQALALVAYGLRVWSRRLKRRGLDTSDWLSLASSILALLLSLILFAGAVIGGAGYHQTDLTSNGSAGTSSFNNAAKIIFASELIWLTSNTLTKLSTLAFYAVVFRVSRFIVVVRVLAGLTVAMYVAFVLKNFLICTPVERNWTFDIENPEDYCGVTTSGTLATGIGIALMDAIIVFAPMPIVLKLQMPLTKKLMICGIFSLGLIVCIISALRLVSVLQLDREDLTYTIIDLGIFTILEPLLAIIACCLPTLHPVLLHLSSSPFLDWTRRGSRSGKRTNRTGESTTLRGTQRSNDQRSNQTKNFNRLYDHLYPVTTATVAESTVHRPDHPENEFRLSDMQPWLRDRGGKGAISVTKEFEVDVTHVIRSPIDKPLPSVPEASGSEDVELGYLSGERKGKDARTFVSVESRSRDELSSPGVDTEPVSPMSIDGPRRF